MKTFQYLLAACMVLAITAVQSRASDPVVPGSDQCQDQLPPGQCWTTEDVIDGRIDHHAQSAMLRMFTVGGAKAADASAILCAVKRGQLEGVYLPDQQVPALRSQSYGGWWTIIPQGKHAECYKQPSERAPLIAFRKQIKDNKDFVANAISTAWRECGIPSSAPRCYTATISKPPPEKPELPPLTAGLTIMVTADGVPVAGAEVGVAEPGSGFSGAKTTGGEGIAAFDPPSGTVSIWVYPPSSEFKMAFRQREVVAGTSDGLIVELERQEVVEKQCDNDEWNRIFNACGSGVLSGAVGCIGDVWKEFLACRGNALCVSKIFPKFWLCKQDLDHKRKIQACVDKANAASGCSHPGPQ